MTAVARSGSRTRNAKKKRENHGAPNRRVGPLGAREEGALPQPHRLVNRPLLRGRTTRSSTSAARRSLPDLPRRLRDHRLRSQRPHPRTLDAPHRGLPPRGGLRGHAHAGHLASATRSSPRPSAARSGRTRAGGRWAPSPSSTPGTILSSKASRRPSRPTSPTWTRWRACPGARWRWRAPRSTISRPSASARPATACSSTPRWMARCCEPTSRRGGGVPRLGGLPGGRDAGANPQRGRGTAGAQFVRRFL